MKSPMIKTPTPLSERRADIERAARLAADARRITIADLYNSPAFTLPMSADDFHYL